MQPLEEHAVAHLFVLIGENPLPAYVAARTMLKPNGTLYPVYTSHTASVLEHLKKTLDPWLQDGSIGAIKPVALDKDESDAFRIAAAVKDKIEKIDAEAPQGDWSIGLNYTGGTAPMGVHSYNTLRRLRPDAVFSYLDPRRLEMCVDRMDGERIRRPVPLKMTIDELIDLHGRQRVIRPDDGAPVMLDAARDLAALQGGANVDEMDNWRQWCEGELKPKARPGRTWKSNAQLRGVTLDVSALSDGHKRILTRYFGVTDDKLSLAASHGDFRSPKELCEWLDGTWLESYVLDQVKQAGGDIGGSARSIHVQPSINPNQNQFEFDVAFVVGYQLFGISCTTSAIRGECKLKLLEAYVRARQLGGDEARVGLVCMSTDTQGLKNELTAVLLNDKIEVFGRMDLPGLSDKLRAWVDRTKAAAS